MVTYNSLGIKDKSLGWNIKYEIWDKTIRANELKKKKNWSLCYEFYN